LFENRVFRRIFRPKRDEVTGEWRKYIMRNLMICPPHPTLFGVMKSRRMISGACSTMGARRGVYMVLVGKPEGKGPIRRPRRRWEDNIKMGLQEVGCGGVDWIELAHDEDRTCDCGNEPSGSIKCGEFLD